MMNLEPNGLLTAISRIHNDGDKNTVNFQFHFYKKVRGRCGQNRVFLLYLSFPRRRAQVVRERSAKPLFSGSNPLGAFTSLSSDNEDTRNKPES